MSSMRFVELDNTTAPERSLVEKPAKDAYPPVSPSFQTSSSSFPDRTNQPRPTVWLARSAGRRVRSNMSIAGRSGALASLRQVAFMNVRRSFAVDRNAPAPASVGMSQFDAGLRVL